MEATELGSTSDPRNDKTENVFGKLAIFISQNLHLIPCYLPQNVT